MLYSPVALRMVVPNWCHKKNCFHQQGLLLTYGHLKLYGSIKMYHGVRINMNCFMILTFESMVLTWPLAFPQDKCVLLVSRNLLWTLKCWKSNCTFPPFFMSPFSCQTCYLSFPLLTWLFWERRWWGQGAGGPPSGWPISCSWTWVVPLFACFTCIRGHGWAVSQWQWYSVIFSQISLSILDFGAQCCKNEAQLHQTTKGWFCAKVEPGSGHFTVGLLQLS